MMPGINPAQMKAAMKQMGIKQEEVDALRVVIECEDKKIIVENPSVIKINMQGNESFQISGEVSSEEVEEGISEEDIELVAEKTGKTREEAKEALEKSSGDLTEAIMELS
ncbi:MAG: nascent polypeptide-associated complex protein [Nanoarchaeota archaeon]|nr:nascent polypeptide-associated complex protein [Nanoarchaeota archaeon]